ncbi:MAG: transcription antitermination factor NusB [Gemmatimonadales bacterium]|nr:transcription antitermination factor NusB [Gemmatimonadales bacterium]
MAVKPDTRARARACQLLYAWEVQGRPPLGGVVAGLARLVGARATELDAAADLAEAIVADVVRLDRETAAAAEHWRLERLGLLERCILRVGARDLGDADVAPKLAIDRAVRLAQWFAGAKAGGFVNGVLDRIARDRGRL